MTTLRKPEYSDFGLTEKKYRAAKKVIDGHLLDWPGLDVILIKIGAVFGVIFGIVMFFSDKISWYNKLWLVPVTIGVSTLMMGFVLGLVLAAINLFLNPGLKSFIVQLKFFQAAIQYDKAMAIYDRQNRLV